MNKMQEGLAVHAKAMQERRRAERAEEKVAELEKKIREINANFNFVCDRLVKEPAFLDWLMDQDQSCAYASKPSNKFRPNFKVEKASNRKMALAYSQACHAVE